MSVDDIMKRKEANLYLFSFYWYMRLLSIFVIIITILIVVWVAWSYFGTRSIEKPGIVSSVSLSGWVELREVSPMIEAFVLVDGPQNVALNQWFRQIAWYIFWSNVVKESIAMTAPVSVSKNNEVIAMTAPVALQEDAWKYRVSFMMPNKFSLDTLPEPINENISFEQIPSKKYYVWKFSGYANASKANKQLDLFIAALKEQKLSSSSTPILNQYNDPWTIWFMRKNEWWISVE